MTRSASLSRAPRANQSWPRREPVAAGGASSTPFIDWSLLARIAIISIAAGVGLVAAFSIGLAALSFTRNEENGRLARMGARALALLMGAAIVAALVWGFVLIVRKS
jgi:hypothetical protein